jgi:hypothetical protein
MVPIYFTSLPNPGLGVLEGDAVEPFDRAPLPGGVTAGGPFLARQCGFNLHGLQFLARDPREESLFVIAGHIDGQPHQLVMGVEEIANIVLSGCEMLSDLGMIRFRAMWATARRVFNEAGLATRPAGELLGAEHC